MLSGNRISWIGKVVLMAALSIFALDASAQTKKLGFSGRPTNLHERNLDDYVDYSQILNDLGERKVVINIGGYSFAGLLHDDGMKVPESVIDEIVRKTFNEMGFSGGKLHRIEDDIASPGLGSDVDWNGIIGDLFNALGTVLPPVALGNDIVNLAAENQSLLQTVFNVVSTIAMAGFSTTAVASVAPAVALTATICGGVLGVATITSIMINHGANYDAAFKYVDNLLSGDPVGKRIMEGAAERYDFYRRINARVAVEAMKNAKGWVLDIDSYDDAPNTLFGASVKQMAHLTAHMTMSRHIGNDAIINWQGTYDGNFKLTFTHDLKNFDSHFKSEVLMRSELPFFKSSVLEFPGEAEGPASELYKELSSDNYSIDFKSSDGTISAGMKQRRDFKDFNDKSFFNCQKDILGKLNYELWEGGNLQVSALSGTSEINLGFLGKLVDNRCSAALKVLSQDDFSRVLAPKYSYDKKMAVVNLEGELLFVDRRIFSDLKNGMFMEVKERKATWL